MEYLEENKCDHNESQMPFGFWVLGNTQYKPECTEEELRSQMPFGFWVLGNTEKRNGNVRLVF